MRRYDRAGHSLFEPVQIVDGPKTRAVIQRPPEIDRPGAEFSHPTMTCRVRRGSLVKPGMVLRLPSGDHYLVANHSATFDWVTFHMFRCDRQVTWTRPASTTDPLTGLPRKTGTPSLIGRPWVMWERVRRQFEDLNLRVAQEQHLFATGIDVQIEDLIDDMRVTRINTALGIKIVELQG